MAHSFDICIDESGDQGFTFGDNQSSHWFVVAGVVGLASRTPQMTAAVHKAKIQAGLAVKKALHFKDVMSERREPVVECFTADPSLFRAIVIMVHKPSLEDPEIFNERNRLYFYFTRYLLERASWLCRDSREQRLKQHGDGSARVVFSCMDAVSHERIGKYFSDLRAEPTTIEWGVIKPDLFITRKPSEHAGLQIADSVASGFFCGDHPKDHKRSPRWCEMWKPMLYSYKSRYRGYGMKIFPPAAEKQIAQGTLSAWANLLYPA